MVISSLEHFIVWMRVAAMPNFRKLWGRIEKDLNQGTYKMVIEDNYDVSGWDGQKYFVLSEVNSLGGRNHFLGILYLAAGGLCCFFAMLFIIAKLMRGNKEDKEPEQIRWR